MEDNLGRMFDMSGGTKIVPRHLCENSTDHVGDGYLHSSWIQLVSLGPL
jgi:hypothetical protein